MRGLKSRQVIEKIGHEWKPIGTIGNGSKWHIWKGLGVNRNFQESAIGDLMGT
jgi:hypothetical protein